MSQQEGRGIVQGRKYLTITFKGNLILQKYFGKTLRRTDFWWPDSKKASWKILSIRTVFMKVPFRLNWWQYFLREIYELELACFYMYYWVSMFPLDISCIKNDEEI